MNDNVLTADDEHIAGALHALRKGVKEVSRLAENYRPPLGGERYMTDKEVAERLKVSRRTLQEYRNNRENTLCYFRWESPVPGNGHRKDAGRELQESNPVITDKGQTAIKWFAPCLFFSLTQKAVF